MSVSIFHQESISWFHLFIPNKFSSSFLHYYNFSFIFLILFLLSESSTHDYSS